jgi:Tol biopolymer transport system component
VSVDTAGVEGNGAVSGRPAISADGRYVAFASSATNLVWNDRNNEADVFVRDRAAQVTARVSLSGIFVEGNASSGQPAISADGKIVAFSSKATNLVAGDTNGRVDVFVRDLTPRWPTTTRVSLSGTGTEGDGVSNDPSISGDGQFVTFTSSATNLVPGDANASSDVFLRDRTAATTSLVSANPNGGPGNAPSANAEISPDGTWIAFDSYATDLVRRDTNGRRDVFLRERTSSSTVTVSLSTSDGPGNHDSFEPTVSNLGVVAFSSDATNLVSRSDTNGVTDVFVRSTSTYRSSQARGGAAVGGWAPAISADSSALVFASGSASLAPNDTNGVADLFMPSRRTPNCTPSSGGRFDCDLTAGGEPVPGTVEWYFDGVHDPSLDNLTTVQVTLCQLEIIAEVRVVIGGGAGIAELRGTYGCVP